MQGRDGHIFDPIVMSEEGYEPFEDMDSAEKSTEMGVPRPITQWPSKKYQWNLFFQEGN